jgi:hypothetical protein
MTETTTRAAGFQAAERRLAGLTAPVEKRALLWMAPRVQGRVTSDVTVLVLGGLALSGLISPLVAAGTRALVRAEGWAPPLGGDSRPGERARRRSLVEGEALSLV